MLNLLNSMLLDPGLDAKFQVSQIKPIIHRATQSVVSWRYVLTVTLGEYTGFDEYTIQLPEQEHKALAAWSIADLRALFMDALKTDKRIQNLVKIVQFRRDFVIIQDFDLMQLQGATYEQLPSA